MNFRLILKAGGKFQTKVLSVLDINCTHLLKMTTFDCLPFDVIDYILNCDCLTYKDICRLASVSKIFNCVAKSNKLWRRKYGQMWPELSKLYNAQNTYWKHEFRVRIDFKKMIQRKLSELSVEYYYYENLSNEAFFYFRDIAENHPFGYQIVIQELETGINDPNSHLNLTHKYYALKALRYIRHVQLEFEWKKYLSQSSNQISLVEGLCLISQWCQPNSPACTSGVLDGLNEIAILVFDKLKELFPHHPIVKKGITKDDMIPESVWSPRQCKDILYCLNSVLFQDLKFTGDNSEHSSTESTLIDKVNLFPPEIFFLCRGWHVSQMHIVSYSTSEVLTQKLGVSITLGVIYGAVAARLGVSCLAVNFPGRFILKWLEHPGMDEKEAFTFIDVNDNGAFKTYAELPYLAPSHQTFTSAWADAVPAVKIFTRLAWYLVEFARQIDGGGEDAVALCNALELLCILSPDDVEQKLLLARLFMHLGINIPEAISLCQEIAAHDPLSPLTVGYMYQSTLNTLETLKFSRPSTKKKIVLRDGTNDVVKYAVGMVMRHIKYNFRCVIYGWDCHCTASRDWIYRMGVHNLIYNDKQPFYYVLVDDGTNRYAAQENLAIDTEDKPIPHTRVGRYFESFHGRYYLPNALTVAEYPQDIEAREKALQLAEEGN